MRCVATHRYSAIFRNRWARCRSLDRSSTPRCRSPRHAGFDSWLRLIETRASPTCFRQTPCHHQIDRLRETAPYTRQRPHRRSTTVGSVWQVGLAATAIDRVQPRPLHRCHVPPRIRHHAIRHCVVMHRTRVSEWTPPARGPTHATRSNTARPKTVSRPL